MAALLTAGCSGASSAVPKDARAVVGELPGPASMLFFPARWRPPRPRPPLVLVGPELLDARVLYDHEGALVPFLIDRGYPVLLVNAARGPFPDEFGSAGLVRLVEQMHERTGAKEIVVGGVGPGGRHALGLVDALERHRDGAPPVRVSKLFFLGTGLDYAYPDPFFARLDAEGLKGPDLRAQCKDQARRAVCKRMFRSSVRSSGYMDLLRFRAPTAPAPDLRFVADLLVPALFIVGKTDNVSPAESVVPVYRAYGTTARDVPKRYFIAGLENQLSQDYDELSLLLDISAESEVYPIIGAWLDG